MKFGGTPEGEEEEEEEEEPIHAFWSSWVVAFTFDTRNNFRWKHTFKKSLKEVCVGSRQKISF